MIWVHKFACSEVYVFSFQHFLLINYKIKFNEFDKCSLNHLWDASINPSYMQSISYTPIVSHIKSLQSLNIYLPKIWSVNFETIERHFKAAKNFTNEGGHFATSRITMQVVINFFIEGINEQSVLLECIIPHAWSFVQHSICMLFSYGSIKCGYCLLCAYQARLNSCLFTLSKYYEVLMCTYWIIKRTFRCFRCLRTQILNDHQN